MLENKSGDSRAIHIPPATGSSIINIGTGERIASVLGGLALASLGVRNMKKGKGIALLFGGGYLLTRGLVGYCAVNHALHRNTVSKNASAIQVSRAFTINKPRAEVYAYWRKLENLPRFMKHLSEVKETDATHSHWTAVIPRGLGTVSWEAEIVEDRADEYIFWQSLPGSTIDNAGEVTFKDAPGQRGTEVHAIISYRLPAGDVGALAAKLINPVVELLIQEDLRRFKNILETGEIPTAEGPSGRLQDKVRSKLKKFKQSYQHHNYEGPMLERH
jgi:uncharacterized membrane protein